MLKIGLFCLFHSFAVSLNFVSYYVERQPTGDKIYGVDCIEPHAIKHGSGCMCITNGTFYHDYYATHCIQGSGFHSLGMFISNCF